MASSSDIRAGGAFVELYLKGGDLVESGLDAVSQKTRAFTTSLTTMATVANITYGHSATALRTSLQTISGLVDKTGSAIRTSVRATADVLTGTLNGIQKSVSNVGNALQSFGTTSLFSGLLAGGAGVQTMNSFMEFEKQMQRVKAMTGETGLMFDAMTEKVRELGRTTQYTSAQAAEGLAYLAMAGLDARDSIDVLPVVLDLATAAMMDLGQTADIVTDIGLAFGYTGKETQRVADVIAQAATNSNTTVEMMGMSFKYLAAFAVAAGQEIEDMAAAVALLAQVGIKKNTAGTGLREALVNMVTPAKRQKLWDVLGVEIADAEGDIRPFFDIIKDIKASLSTMQQDDQLAVMSQIFGKRGGNVMLSLVHQTTDALDGMQQTIIHSEGATKRMADTMRNSLWGSWKEFVSVIEDIQIEIGQALVPAVRGFLKYFTEALQGLDGFIAKNHDLIVGLSLSIPALIASGAAALALGKALSFVATVMTPVVTALNGGIAAISASIIGATGLLTVFSVALTTVASGVQSVAAVMQSAVGMLSMMAMATGGAMVSLILLAKLPIVLSEAFMWAVGGISSFFATITSGAKSAANAVETVTNVAKTTTDVVDILVEAANTSAAAANKSMGAALGAIEGAINTYNSAVQLAKALTDVGTSATDSIKALTKIGLTATEAADILANTGQTVSDVTAGLFNVGVTTTELADFFGELGMSLGSLVHILTQMNASTETFVETMLSFGASAEHITRILQHMGVSASEIAMELLSAGAAANDVSLAITRAFAKTSSGVASVSTDVTEVMSEMTESLAQETVESVEVASKAFIQLGEVGTEVLGDVAKLSEGTATALADVGTEAAKTSATVGMTLGATLAKLAVGLGALLIPLGLVGSMFWMAWGLIKAVVVGMIDAVSKLAVAFWDAGKSIASAFGSTVINSLSAVGNAFGTLFSNVAVYFQDNKQAFTDWWTSLKSAFSQVQTSFGWVVKALKAGDIENAMKIAKLEAIRQLVNLEEFARALIGNMLVEVPKIVSALGEILTAIFAGIGESFFDLWTTIKQEFRILMAEIPAIFFETIQKIIANSFLAAGMAEAAQLIEGLDINKQAADARKNAQDVRGQVKHERVRAMVERNDPDNLALFDEGKKLYDKALEKFDLWGWDKNGNNNARTIMRKKNPAAFDYYIKANSKEGIAIPEKESMWAPFQKVLDAVDKTLKDVAAGKADAVIKMAPVQIGEDPDGKPIFAESYKDITDALENAFKNTAENIADKAKDDRDGKSERLYNAEKEKEAKEKELSDLQSMGHSGNLIQELIDEIKKLTVIIDEENRGIKGMTRTGQPMVPSSDFWEMNYNRMKADFEKRGVDLNKDSDAYMQLFRAEMLKDLSLKSNKNPLSVDEQAKFDLLRTQFYMGRGGAVLDTSEGLDETKVVREGRISEKDAWDMVQTENRGSLLDKLQKDRDMLKLSYDESSAKRSELYDSTNPQKNARERGNLTANMKMYQSEIAMIDRQMKGLGGFTLTTGGRNRFNAEYLDRVQNSTFTGGTFSAYDVMRGGVQQDELVNELRTQTKIMGTQTGLLQSIDENVNTID